MRRGRLPASCAAQAPRPGLAPVAGVAVIVSALRSASFKQPEACMPRKVEAAPNTSARQEFLENLINEFT